MEYIISASRLPQVTKMHEKRLALITQLKSALTYPSILCILGVLVVQLEGKQAMSAAEFLRGQRDFIGAVLPG